jgi:hypothetical protein
MKSVSTLVLVFVCLATSPAMAAGSTAPVEDTGADAHRADSPIPPDRDRMGWAVPDYARLQTGGFSGMVSVGFGYSALRDIVNVGVAYGYVPARSDAPEVHMGTATVQLRPLRATLGEDDRFYYYPLYAGAGALAASGPNLFLKQPASYPAGYYPATGFHYLLLVGTEVALRMPEGSPVVRHSVYCELVTLNQYFDALIQNRQSRMVDGIASALGYRASF